MHRFRRINFISNSVISSRILSSMPLFSQELYILATNILPFLFTIIFQVLGLALNIQG